MARLRRFYESSRPYFVTTAAANRAPVFADPYNANLLRGVLYETREAYGFLLLSFAIMPDHVHAIIVPDNRNNISQVMRYIKGRFSRVYNERNGLTGAFWQPRFYDRAVRDEEALRAFVRYIDQNPVKAGLIDVPEDYPFSSAHTSCERI